MDKSLAPFEGKYIYVSCNVQEKASLQNLWDTSLQQWGRIDIWINNAGPKYASHVFVGNGRDLH